MTPSSYQPPRTCRWTSNSEPRLLNGRHNPNCDNTTCRGCQECPERHCTVCNREHVTVDGRGTDQTCGPCLTTIRDNLREITTLTEHLLDEAINKGVNSDAADLAGPAIRTYEGIEAFEYRRMSYLMGRIPQLEQDDQHPLWILGTWETVVREHLNQPANPADRITLPDARDYLDRQLFTIAHDPNFPVDELADDLKDCRNHLENVLHEGTRTETGAACPACGGANLVKDYGQDPDDEIRWRCPRNSCGQWWSDPDYRVKVQATYIRHATALTASQIHDVYRIKPGTLRQWANRGTVTRRGKNASGQQLYDVATALAARDQSLQPESA